MSTLTAWQRWWLSSWPHRLMVRRYVPRFLHSCPEPFRGEVLEIGAGHGATSRWILETFPQVELTAIDVDSRMLDRFSPLVTEYGNRLHVVQADVLKLPFDRASFDYVVAINVMRHVSERREACVQALRVLRPGGWLGISDRTLPALQSELVSILKDEQYQVYTTSHNLQADIWAKKVETT